MNEANGIDPARLASLEAALESDPGAPGFFALAEQHRRAGRLREAEQVLRRGLVRSADAADARLVLALVLLDQAREQEARTQLARSVGERLLVAGFASEQGSTLAAAGVSDAELELAFHQAETDAERLITPNRVAEEALARVDGGAVEGLHEGVLEPGSAFATATMAELLARQGDAQGAQRIRASLESQPRRPAPASGAPNRSAPGASAPGRARRIATLERWLANLRGGRS